MDPLLTETPCVPSEGLKGPILPVSKALLFVLHPTPAHQAHARNDLDMLSNIFKSGVTQIEDNLCQFDIY